jgi:two-component system OmpR family sensor kinase
VWVGVDGDDAVIEVRDHGPGMTEEDAARAFERFWRADPSRDRASGGAGLGLAIVSAITTAHGGRAEVATAPGEGATFRIRLPRERELSPTAP